MSDLGMALLRAAMPSFDDSTCSCNIPPEGVASSRQLVSAKSAVAVSMMFLYIFFM